VILNGTDPTLAPAEIWQQPFEMKKGKRKKGGSHGTNGSPVRDEIG
jgi:hypothetical protein